MGRKTNGLARITNTKIIAKKNIKKAAAPSPPSLTKASTMNAIPVIMKTSIEETKSPETLSPSSSENSFDVISTNKLSAMTSGRAKPPKRRPPSQHFLKENIPDLIDIKVEESEEEEEEEVESRVDSP